MPLRLKDMLKNLFMIWTPGALLPHIFDLWYMDTFTLGLPKQATEPQLDVMEITTIMLMSSLLVLYTRCLQVKKIKTRTSGTLIHSPKSVISYEVNRIKSNGFSPSLKLVWYWVGVVRELINILEFYF